MTATPVLHALIHLGALTVSVIMDSWEMEHPAMVSLCSLVSCPDTHATRLIVVDGQEYSTAMFTLLE